MEEERMADGQAEVQPLPDMDPELSAPPPPLPEATIPSRHDAVAAGGIPATVIKLSNDSTYTLGANIPVSPSSVS